MSPTPVTFASPTAPVGVLLGGHQRGGRGALRRARSTDRPLRPEHLAHAAGPRDAAPGGRPFRDAALRVPAVRLPPPDRRRRRPVRRRDRASCSSAPAPTRSSTSSPRPSCRPAAARSSRSPTYAMYRVLTEQRGATRRRRPAPGRRRLGDGRCRHPDRRARTAQPSSGCAAPTTRPRSPEPDGAIAHARWRTSPRTPTADGRAAPIVVLDEAYAEFVGPSLARPPRDATRTSSSSGPRARPTRWPACGSASRSRGPRSIAAINPYRPPGSVSTVSVTLVTEALRDPAILEANLARVERERTRLRAALARRRLGRRPIRDELHARGLRDAGTCGGHRRGAPATRPRAAHVRRWPSARRLPAAHRPRPATRTTDSSPRPRSRRRERRARAQRRPPRR